MMRDLSFTGFTNFTLDSSPMVTSLGGLLELGDASSKKGTLYAFSVLRCEEFELNPNWVASKIRAPVLPTANWQTRYVRSISTTAARVGQNRMQCIVANDTACTNEIDKCVFCSSFFAPDADCVAPERHCERVANCRWGRPLDGEVRSVTYCSETDILEQRTKLFPNGSLQRCDEFLVDDVTASTTLAEEYFALRTGIMSISERLGIAYAILFAIFLFFRCGINQCGGRFGDSKASHSTKEITFPLRTLFVASIGIMAACGLGFVSIIDGDHTLEIFFVDYGLFLEEAKCYLDKMSSPLRITFDGIISTSNDVQSDIKNAQWLYRDPEELKMFVLRHEAVYEKWLKRPDFKEYVKNFNFNKYIGAIISDIDKQAITNLVVPLKSSVEVATSDFVDLTATIQEDVGSALDSIDTFLASISIHCNRTDQLCLSHFPHDLYSSFESTHACLKDGLVVILATTSLVVTIALVAILLGPTPYQDDSIGMHLMNFVWISDAIICTISFTFAGYAVFKFAYWNDICSFADVAITDLSPFLDSQSSIIANSIVANLPFLSTFNLTDDFKFADTITTGLGVVEKLKIKDEMFASLTTVKAMQEAMDTQVDVQGAIDELSQWTMIFVKQPIFREDCTYTDQFSKLNVRYPWADRAAQDKTLWGDPQISYIRQRGKGDPREANETHGETAREYMKRIYSQCTLELECDERTSKCTTIDDKLLEKWEIAKDLAQLQEDMVVDLGIYGTLWSEQLGNRLGCYRGGKIPGRPFKPSANMMKDRCLTLGFPRDGRYTQNVVTFFDQLENRLLNLQATLLKWLTGRVGNLIDNVNDFRCKMIGGFLMTWFVETHDTLCTNYLQHLFDTVINMWMIPILKVFSVCAAALLAPRIRGDWCLHPKLKREHRKKIERSRRQQKKKQNKVAVADSSDISKKKSRGGGYKV